MLATLEEHLDARLLAELRAVPVRRGVPLLAVDADEVLVYLADHLARFLGRIGWRPNARPEFLAMETVSSG